MGKGNLVNALASFKIDEPTLSKLLQQSFKEGDVTHEVRIFFKKIKAHIGLIRALWAEHIELSDSLRTYYQQTWLLRDAEIFYALCKEKSHKNKLIMILAKERVLIAKEQVEKYKHTIRVDLLAKEIQQLMQKIVTILQSFDPKWLTVGLETFLEQTENLLQQLLESPTITNSWIHTLRKHIKRVLYLLDYMCIYDKKTYTPIQEKYKKFAEDLGQWNDLQLLVHQLKDMTWSGKEAKIIKKLSCKEKKAKKKILKKLRTYFHVSPKQISKETERVIATKQKKSDSLLSANQPKEPIVHQDIKETTLPSHQSKPSVSTLYSWTTKKTLTKKAPVKKAPIKKAPIKKTPVKKTPVKTTSQRKSVVRAQSKTSPRSSRKPSSSKKQNPTSI